MKLELSLTSIKNEMGLIARLESGRASDELVEFRGTEDIILEEGCDQLVELRGIDTGHKVLQVFVGPSELKLGEGKENTASCRRRRRRWWWWKAVLVIMMKVCELKFK